MSVSESIVRFHVSLGLLKVVVLISIVQILRTMEKGISTRSNLLVWYEQSARDRGRVTDCEPLWISGSRGTMFKVTLTFHGCTVIAKGVRLHHVSHLNNEAKVYHHLRSIQGIHIPVCLGAIDLVLPYYHQGDEFLRFLFQSYAGVSVRQAISEKIKSTLLSNLTHAMNAIHRLRVLHCDPMPRNFMMDEKTGAVQIIEFERAGIYEKKKIEVASSRKKKKKKMKLPVGARLANETVVPSASSASRNRMIEQPAGQNCEEAMMTEVDILFKKELGAHRYKIAPYFDDLLLTARGSEIPVV